MVVALPVLVALLVLVALPVLVALLVLVALPVLVALLALVALLVLVALLALLALLPLLALLALLRLLQPDLHSAPACFVQLDATCQSCVGCLPDSVQVYTGVVRLEHPTASPQPWALPLLLAQVLALLWCWALLLLVAYCAPLLAP